MFSRTECAKVKNFETAARAYRFIGLSGAEIRCRSLQGVEPLRLGGSTGMTAVVEGFGCRPVVERAAEPRAGVRKPPKKEPAGRR
jgi:hypothetical protein